MCISNLSNAGHDRKFRVVEKTAHVSNPKFPSRTTFYVQMCGNRKDVWNTVKAFCLADVEQAKKLAYDLKTMLSTPAAKLAKIKVEVPVIPVTTGKTALPEDITYAQMKSLITSKGLNIKKNLSAAVMRVEIEKALNEQ